MVSNANIATLKLLNVETLNRLKSVLIRVNQSLYTYVNPKGNASVGQHVRHTIEFYLCLFSGGDNVNYDDRKRDLLLESSAEHAIVTINETIERLAQLQTDYPISLGADMPTASPDQLQVGSTLARELLYVVEHAIHHMALIRVLIKDAQPEFELEEAFGVAYSTLAYRSQEANG